MTVALAISLTSGLVFHSALLRGINEGRFDDFLAQTRLNLDPDERMIFIYDGALAHRNPAIRRPNSELRKLPPYSPFLNIVEQAVSALKAAIKADISRPEIQVQMNDRTQARRQGLALGNYRTQLLIQALQRNIGTITVAKCGQLFRFMQTYLPRSKQSKDNSLKLRNHFEILFPFIVCHYYTKCLTICGIECNFSINDCLLTPLIVPLYAN